MLINRTFKPWEVCSNEAGREVLHRSFLDVEKSLLISTNGKILSQLPVTVEDGDVSGLIDMDALKAANKIKTMCGTAGNRTESRLDCTSPDSVKLADGRTWPRTVPGNVGAKFPNWEQVMPKNAGRGTVRISFNAELLSNLFAAMGADERAGVTLEFQVDEEHDAKGLPVLVTSAGMSGVLLPFKTLSRAPNRLDDIEQAHSVAVKALDINAADAANVKA